MSARNDEPEFTSLISLFNAWRGRQNIFILIQIYVLVLYYYFNVSIQVIFV